MEGIKRKRRCDSDCEDHILDIKANKGISSKYDFRQQFCPKYQREPMPPEHTYPQYNNDGKYYTTAFILGVDRRVLNKNDLQEVMDHQKLIRDSLQKHNQLVFPRPNSKHSLCSVCKEQYKNYYIHIASDQHGEKIGLSPYNQHILGLCNRYIELWEGAEQKADEEAERRAAQDKIRRQKQEEQRMQEEEEEDDNGSLLDVDRGQNAELDQDRDDDDQQGLYTVKPNQSKSKKKVRSAVFIDQDTVPLNVKASKRSNPDGHHHHEYPRKKFIGNDANPIRALRMHQQKKFEKQRQKVKSGRDCAETREFIAGPADEGDLFIIMKMIHHIAQNTEQVTKKLIQQDKPKKQFDRPIENIQKIQAVVNVNQKQLLPAILSFEINGKVRELQIIYAKSQPTEIDKPDQGTNQIIKSRKQHLQRVESIHTHKVKQNKIQKFPFQHERVEKNDSRHVPLDMRPPPTMNHSQYYKKLPEGYKYVPETYKQVNQSYKYFQQTRYPQITKNGHSYGNQNYKSIQEGYKVHPENKPENYKSLNPNNYNYYNPYMYGVYEPPYRDKGYEYQPNDKEKSKSGEKSYQYVPYTQWPYHPSSYYMPPVQPHGQQINSPPQQPNSDQPNPNPPKTPNMPNPYAGGTSININFPMYMCPPPPHHSLQGMSYSLSPSRYPMPPMMHSPYNVGYQYPQYANNQQPGGRQGEYSNPQSQVHGLTGTGQPQPQSQSPIQGSQTQQLHPTGHQLPSQHQIPSNQHQIPPNQHPNYQPNFIPHQYSGVPYPSHQHSCQIPPPELSPHK